MVIDDQDVWHLGLNNGRVMQTSTYPKTPKNLELNIGVRPARMGETSDVDDK